MRETNETLETLISISSEAIAIIDRDGIVQFWNEPAEKVYQIQAKDIIGQPIQDFFHTYKLKLLEVIQTQQAIYDVYHQPKQGKHIVINASPIMNKEGQIIGAVSVDRDISDTVKLSDELSMKVTELQNMKQQIQERATYDPLESMIGESEAIVSLKRMISKVASTQATVLIQGESGVGKELVAQGIHDASERSKEPFVAVNCGAIPKALFESELFGYEAGAFTGADRKGKIGKIEYASKGTLFLDEVGTLSLDMQVKLLRVLQEREFYRVGGTSPIEVDTRIVAATNSDLLQMIEAGEFREDLYYRLNVIHLNVPPLCEREKDVLLLFHHFIEQFSLKYKQKTPTLSIAAQEKLLSYRFPGNVRELRNMAERLIVFLEKEEVGIDEISAVMPQPIETLPVEPKAMAVTDEKMKIIQALERTYGNKSAAAQLLGISRVTLYNRMKRYDL